MSIQVRRFQEVDRVWVAALLSGNGTIDAKQTRIEIVEDGEDKALAVWLSPDGDGLPILGTVLNDGRQRLNLFRAAIVAVCEAGIAEGHTRGRTLILKQRIMMLVARDFDLTFTPVGTNVKTGEPGRWEVEVALADIVSTAKRKGFV